MAEEDIEKIGRRDAMKIMIAGAGAITASAFFRPRGTASESAGKPADELKGWISPALRLPLTCIHARPLSTGSSLDMASELPRALGCRGEAPVPPAF